MLADISRAQALWLDIFVGAVAVVEFLKLLWRR